MTQVTRPEEDDDVPSVKRHDRRARKRLAAVAAVATLAPALAACGGETGGTVVNLYGGASAAGFDKIIAACNKEAAGKYTIVGNLLPSDADGQRSSSSAGSQRRTPAWTCWAWT